MTLEPGLYTISCRGTEAYIGRHVVEDKSLLPKRIVNLPKGVVTPGFTVEKSAASEECYVLRASGGLVAEKDQLLWASVLDSFAPPTYLWRITAQPQHGQHIYMSVETAPVS